MALRDTLEQLQNLDLADLDFNNIGTWPAAAKGILLFVVFAAAGAAGYFLYLTPKLEERDRLAAEETQLRSQFTDKAMQAANLEELRQQRIEMEESFGALLRQLPSDTEVPGLLEDITLTGLDNGLKFSAIDLQPERAAEFYVELPIAITVEGGYHNMGAFVSGVANLSRIVSLHDFSIGPLGGEGGQQLNMQIQAKTYRYLDTEGP
ncbi:MAG: type 4a pilus biogenesis protein PilO [Pseudomonadales bacterium]|jgi:type IV pilus assembly protein PilO|nr:type 4a pilus biogenesis protein PilO [Pseudomonadales bacterium]